MEGRAGDLQRGELNYTLVDASSGGKAAADVDLIWSIQDSGQCRVVEAAFA